MSEAPLTPSPAVRYVLVALVTAHLVFIGFCSFKRPPGKFFSWPAVTKALDVYGYLTGAGSHYGFFAPGVVSQFAVDYELLKDGQVIASAPLATKNPETTFRLYNIVQNFWLTQAKTGDDVRRSLAGSLAGKVLAEHPEADGIRLFVRAYVLPSMKGYRGGERPAWETHYQADFQRNAGGTTP